MSDVEEAWDYCHIEFKLLDNLTDHGRSGFRMGWLRFVAFAEGGGQVYVAGESEKVAMPYMAGVTLSPDRRNAGHLNIHSELVRRLQADGWEMVSRTGSAWWQTQLRRPASRRPIYVPWWRRLWLWWRGLVR